MHKPLTAILMQASRKFWIPCLLFCGTTFLSDSPAFTQEPVAEASSDLKLPLDRLSTAKKATEQSKSLENRVRETTWRLLVGEVAAMKDNGLSSSAYDSLSQGLNEMDILLDELEKSPELERQLSQDPRLALRMDVTKVRISELVAAKVASRTDELARLSQLRELNRAYRSLLQHLIAEQTESFVGSPENTLKNGQQVATMLEDVDKIASQRRDFYLFDDEPQLENENTDQKRIREIAAPYAQDVRRHHQAILSLTLRELATQKQPADEALLQLALQQADAALTGSDQPTAVALYAQGLICLELGLQKTAQTPFSQQSHEAAAPLFAKSNEALHHAKKLVPNDTEYSRMSREIDRLLLESSDPAEFANAAVSAEQQGNIASAVQYLNRGISRHRNSQLAIAWIEMQWRHGILNAAQPEDQLNVLVMQGVVKADDLDFLAVRSRILIGQAWSTLSASPEILTNDDTRSSLIKQLESGLADCNSLTEQSGIPPKARLQAESQGSLAVAALLLIEPQRDTTTAVSALNRAPVIAMELESLAAKADVAERNQLLSAVQNVRLAEGYLAARLLPDYQDRARLAFAAAADVGTRLGGDGGQPVGHAVLRAIMTRDDASADRLAQEERQLRTSLQKMLPALVSISLANPQQVADSLSKALTDVESKDPAWDPRQQLDVKDVRGARVSVAGDVRAVTALTMVAANRPAEALGLYAKAYHLGMQQPALTASEWASLNEAAIQLSDPLELFAFGMAAEEYAVVSLPESSKLRESILKDAASAYVHASKLTDESNAWKERWPYLADMIRASSDRLSSDKSAILQAEVLRKAMRISEAREVISKSLQRHPDSVLLREQLILALIDNATVSPSRESELLKEALDTLETVKASSNEMPTSTLLILGELRERFGNPKSAADAYREVNQRSVVKQEQLKARSRLASILARSRI